MFRNVRGVANSLSKMFNKSFNSIYHFVTLWHVHCIICVCVWGGGGRGA
jgi:hypothetical protein